MTAPAPEPATTPEPATDEEPAGLAEAHHHTDLWWHLIEDHHISLKSTQGDPEVLHRHLHTHPALGRLRGVEHTHEGTTPA